MLQLFIVYHKLSFVNHVTRFGQSLNPPPVTPLNITLVPWCNAKATPPPLALTNVLSANLKFKYNSHTAEKLY